MLGRNDVGSYLGLSLSLSLDIYIYILHRSALIRAVVVFRVYWRVVGRKTPSFCLKEKQDGGASTLQHLSAVEDHGFPNYPPLNHAPQGSPLVRFNSGELKPIKGQQPLGGSLEGGDWGTHDKRSCRGRAGLLLCVYRGCQKLGSACCLASLFIWGCFYHRALQHYPEPYTPYLQTGPTRA